ncbi:MAG: hypothetical protein ACO3A2_04165 [Bdellovibrionia bacterium]
MALLHDAVDLKRLDVRLIEKNIARGVIKKEDVEKALHALPDDAENADWISLESFSPQIDESQRTRSVNSQQH